MGSKHHPGGYRPPPRALSKFTAFSVTLASTGRFPGVLYLEPAPLAPVLALSRAIWRSFPETPPYAGALDHEPVPHLTAAKGEELDAAEREVRRRIQEPVTVLVDKVSISAEGAGSDGRWAVVAEVELGG